MSGMKLNLGLSDVQSGSIDNRRIGKPIKQVSVRKVQANRQNALKSTGPKTPRGKAYSRQNAIKHGLFALDSVLGDGIDCGASQQYHQLLDRLMETWKPVGATEQLEVERITACWWKLGRAWRYENAEITILQAEGALREKQTGDSLPHMALLMRAKNEIETTGAISEEVQAKLFAYPELRQLWESLETVLRDSMGDTLEGLRTPPGIAKHHQKDFSASVLLATALHSIDAVGSRRNQLMKNLSDQVAVPGSEVLDRVLRADAAAERNLGRATDRLERLQRRRQGEAVPPPMNVRLSR
jgi:hypothetical protein